MQYLLINWHMIKLLTDRETKIRLIDQSLMDTKMSVCHRVCNISYHIDKTIMTYLILDLFISRFCGTNVSFNKTYEREKCHHLYSTIVKKGALDAHEHSVVHINETIFHSFSIKIVLQSERMWGGNPWKCTFARSWNAIIADST